VGIWRERKDGLQDGLGSKQFFWYSSNALELADWRLMFNFTIATGSSLFDLGLTAGREVDMPKLEEGFSRIARGPLSGVERLGVELGGGTIAIGATGPRGEGSGAGAGGKGKRKVRISWASFCTSCSFSALTLPSTSIRWVADLA
jgi:hypothetical protein